MTLINLSRRIHHFDSTYIEYSPLGRIIINGSRRHDLHDTIGLLMGYRQTESLMIHALVSALKVGRWVVWDSPVFAPGRGRGRMPVPFTFLKASSGEGVADRQCCIILAVTVWYQFCTWWSLPDDPFSPDNNAVTRYIRDLIRFQWILFHLHFMFIQSMNQNDCPFVLR